MTRSTVSFNSCPFLWMKSEIKNSISSSWGTQNNNMLEESIREKNPIRASFYIRRFHKKTDSSYRMEENKLPRHSINNHRLFFASLRFWSKCRAKIRFSRAHVCNSTCHGAGFTHTRDQDQCNLDEHLEEDKSVLFCLDSLVLFRHNQYNSTQISAQDFSQLNTAVINCQQLPGQTPALRCSTPAARMPGFYL